MSEPEPAVAGDTDDEELFPLPQDEHLTPESVLIGLNALLGRYPQAPVAAMKSDGICIPVPPEVQLAENPIMQARSGLDLVVQDDRLRLLATWDTVLERGAARCLTHLAADPCRQVTFCGFDLRETHGVVMVAMVPAGVDDGAGKVTAAAPVRSKPRFSTMAKDERAFITSIDEALTEILGWQPEEMLGRRTIDFIHPDDHPLAIDNWMQMLAAPGAGRRVRLRHRGSDGAWVWFEVTNHNFLDDPERRNVVSELVDISEEMAAHEEVRSRQELLDRIAEAMPMGLLHLDAERRVVYTNDRLHEILGSPRAQDAAEQLVTVLAEDRARLLAALEDVLSHGVAADLEVRLRAPDAVGLCLCAINVRPLRDAEGAVAGAIACLADVTDAARMRDELRQRATYDELTGCYNRASITRLLEGAVTDEHTGRCAVLFIDVDRFKSINDQLGHAAGDELLQVLAERLRRAVRGEDHVGRIGGDEFLVVCPDVTSAATAGSLAARITELAQEPVALAAGVVAPRVSVGVAWAQCPGTSADALVASADAEMYQRKHEGRDEGGSRALPPRV